MDGNLLDKDYEILTPSETPEETVSSLVKQYYLTRCGAPKQIFLPCEMEDAELFAELLQQNLGKKVRINRPQRGDNAVSYTHLDVYKRQALRHPHRD